ncbi:MAG TPA: hypothetical protein VGF45_12875, partial [Polyangia bacterium]
VPLLAARLLPPALLFALAASGDAQTSPATPCEPIPVWENGREVESRCEFELPDGFVVIDLRDDWAPRILRGDPAQPQPYLPIYLALAQERPAPTLAGASAVVDRHYEPFGIFPTISVVRRRLIEDHRHACHDEIDPTPLAAPGRRTIAPRSRQDDPSAQDAIVAMNLHLACDGYLSGDARPGDFGAAVQRALALYQRRHMLLSRPALDVATRATLATSSRELDFRTLLRVLRERIVDATGLIEDGSAGNAWRPVLDRFLEPSAYREILRPEPLANAAPDLIAEATERAAQALGWISPEAARAALVDGWPMRAAIRLPARPAYHAFPAKLRAEIDRGDVWRQRPVDVDGRARPSPVRRRPTRVIYAETDRGEVALVRWPTTIGAFKPEKYPDGSIDLRYKASPVGRRYWRDLIAAPAWYPPPSTPDRELIRRLSGDRWTIDDEAIGPGYRSAYGLVALAHHRAVEVPGGKADLFDSQIRTHGSGNYRSILRGSSHGCHRLFNHLALRLGSFLLLHRAHVREGLIEERYERAVHWKGQTKRLRVTARGYRYRLDPPVAVDVLPGRNVRVPSQPHRLDITPTATLGFWPTHGPNLER